MKNHIQEYKGIIMDDVKHFIGILKSVATYLSSQNPDSDDYHIIIDLCDFDGNKIALNQGYPYSDEKKCFKKQLKKDSKWKVLIINGIIKLSPYQENNQELISALSQPDSLNDDIECRSVDE